MSWKTNKGTGKKFQSRGKGIDVGVFKSLNASDANRSSPATAAQDAEKAVRAVVLEVEKKGLRNIITNNAEAKKYQALLNEAFRVSFEVKDEHGRALYERNKKLWERVHRLQSDIGDLIELRKLPKGTKIYVNTVAHSSTYTGNHAQMTMSYVKDGELHDIRLWCLDMKETKNGFVYTRHGGGYSFSHDLVYTLGRFLHSDEKEDGGYWFKEERR